MRVAVLTPSRTRAAYWLQLLSTETGLEPVRVEADARLSSFRVLLTEGIAPEDLALDGPPVVWIGPPAPGIRTLLGGRIHAALTPDIRADELRAALQAAALELTVLTPAQTTSFLRTRPSAGITAPVEALTPRELEVLRQMADGLGNKELATRLHISDHTAKFHVAQILAKLHATSRAEAVAIGIRNGLVPI